MKSHWGGWADKHVQWAATIEELSAPRSRLASGTVRPLLASSMSLSSDVVLFATVGGIIAVFAFLAKSTLR